MNAIRCGFLLLLGLPTIAIIGADETPPEFSNFAYFQRRLMETPPVLQFPDEPSEVPAWRDRIAERLRDILGLAQSVKVTPRPRLVDVRQREGYRLEHIVLGSELGVKVPAYVLIPDGVSARNRAPAVLCIQGMVPGGKDELAGEVANNPAAAKGLEQYKDDYARQFVLEGFVVIAIDMRHDGERSHRAEPDPFGANQRAAAVFLANKYAIMMGQTFIGLNVFDYLCALDYLHSRPEVIPDAIGCAGFSFGGTLSAWLALLDRRIRVVALEGNWPSWRRLAARSITDDRFVYGGKPMHSVNNATFQLLPGFLRYMDMNLTVAAVAPTPMIIAHESDLSYIYANLEEAERDLAPVHSAYGAFGASGNLKIVHVTGGHHWRREIIVPWFAARLREIASARSLPSQNR